MSRMNVLASRWAVFAESLFAAVALASGACSSSSVRSAPTWTMGSEPAADATVESDSCTALAACCAADEAGNLYCAVTSGCDDAFQYELNYGYCSRFTYSGFVDNTELQPSPGNMLSSGCSLGDGGPDGADTESLGPCPANDGG